MSDQNADFLRETIPYDSGPLDNEETARAADHLLHAMDAEEIRSFAVAARCEVAIP